jgi:hypothetical protein
LTFINQEWIEFIYQNRSILKKYTHNYDYVFGAVADGRFINQTVNAIDRGELEPADMLLLVTNENFAVYDQLLLHTPASVNSDIIKRTRVVHAYDKSRPFEEIATF